MSAGWGRGDGEKELETRGDRMQSNGPDAGQVSQFTTTAAVF